MQALTLHNWWIASKKIRDTLLSIFFLFMPFTQALTFHVGFPLKISELTLLLLAFMYVLGGKKVQLPKPIVYTIALLFFLVTLSFVVNLIWDYSYTLKEYPSRFGYIGDSVSRYIYFVLALLAFFISVDFFLTDTDYAVQMWLYGAVIAALYGWYLSIFSYLKWPVFLLPGMEPRPQTTDSGIIRCGTFLEGNYMGLYLLLSAGMSFYIKKFRTGIFLLASIITTFATLSILGAVLLVFFWARPYLFRKQMLFVLLGLIIAAIIALPYFIETKFYKIYVHEKIFGDVSKVSNNSAFSKADRLTSIRTALDMTGGNPVLGVGLSNFGRHYDHYYNGEGLEKKLYQAFRKKNTKAIPNNIFLEVLSESGVLAFSIFAIFLILLIYYSALYGASTSLLGAMLGMILCFNAYPSFIMIYLWCFMALPVAHYIKNKKKPALPDT